MQQLQKNERAQFFLVWDLIEECVLARRSRTCLRVKSSFHLPCVCVLPSKIKMLFNWPCSAPIKHVSHLTFTCLWLQVCNGVTFFFFFEKSIGVIQIDTYIYMLSHNTYFQYTFYTADHNNNNKQYMQNSIQKKNRPCNICNVAELFGSTYEISHLMLQYLGNQNYQYMERLTQDKVCVLSHICWEQRKYSCLFHAQQLTEKFYTDF